jgi:kynurenine formamidase
MRTYPGLPGPVIGTYLTREAAEVAYGPGVTFHVGTIEICTNTGTYLDTPFHRFADGHDLAGLDLQRVAAVPAVCLDGREGRSIGLDPRDLADRAGHAVLIRTDHSRHFGQSAYAHDHPHLTVAAAEALVSADVACVGIDSLNIDDTGDRQRPVHTMLLRAGIPIVEHLTNLDKLPPDGFTFTAVPPRIEGAGTFTVRAYATISSAQAGDRPRQKGKKTGSRTTDTTSIKAMSGTPTFR